MRYYLFFVLFFSLIFNVNAKNYAEFQEINYLGDKKIIISTFNSEKGKTLLKKAKYKNDLYSLASHFQPQINPLYCGIASSVIILNALNQGYSEIKNSNNIVVKPDIYGGGIINFKTFTQSELLNQNTDHIKPRKVINLQEIDQKLQRYDAGLTLKQLSEILNYYNLKTTIIYAEGDYEQGLKNFKKNLKETLNQENIYIIANFQGKHIGAVTSGHISPLIAYNNHKEQILVMDVASHLQPWFWVNIDEFYKAMQLKDGDKARGYLIVSRNTKN